MRIFQVNTMDNCIASVRFWMTVNKLKLNVAKTEVIVVASSHNQCRLRNIIIKIGEAIVTPMPNVKNLGAVLDVTLSMEKQVSSVVRKMYLNIRKISKVKHHLTKEACANDINATVISHLDYHNALLPGITDRQMHQLQVAQNSAARCLTKTHYRQHMFDINMSYASLKIVWLECKLKTEINREFELHAPLIFMTSFSQSPKLCLINFKRLYCLIIIKLILQYYFG